jgi:hypothetical protein
MVYDAARQEILLFGGQRDGGIRYNDLWAWNGSNWVQKASVDAPAARFYAPLAYDSARQRVVLYGGSHGNQETWEWDGTNWTQRSPSTVPPPHSNSALAYDAARQRTILFGNYAQTWAWDGTNWANLNPVDPPQARNYPAMAYDPVRQEVLLVSGSNLSDTWAWSGTTWTRRTPARQISGRQGGMLVWHGGLQRLVSFGGDIPNVDNYSADLDLWDGTNWIAWSGKTQTFDMSARANGTWNFTGIRIPPGVTVVFNKNAGNTPVRWLATQDVTIDGAISLNGEFGANSLPPGEVAQGGPGGYAGGRGGVRFSASASFVGAPGQGPGGGLPGTAQQTSPENLRDGRQATHAESYGNAFLQPLVGGSGGGGGASSQDADGGNGGGGGGAILISSSRDVIVNGRISANGGEFQWSGASNGGRGSGGAILLRGDRVTGPGTLEAYGGTSGNRNGRLRVEAYTRSLTGGQNPVAVVGLPAANGELNQQGTLTIVSVDGVNVVQPPGGSLQTPDVVFSDAGPVNVVINGVGIPDNTPVRLRVTTGTGVTEAGPVNLVGGSVTIPVTVPKGLGTLQASAQYAAP